MHQGDFICDRGRQIQYWCGDCRHFRPERRRKERRGRCCSFCWTENRSGFDNRQHPARGAAWLRQTIMAMRDNPGLLLQVLLLFNIYNVADFVLTARALAVGSREINPVMRALFAADPLLAGVFKIATGLAVTLVIWRLRRFRLILQLGLFVFFLYVALIAYHLYGVLLV